MRTSTPAIDLYAVLSLAPGASPDAIKAAYRRRARELHPDVEGGDTVQFAALGHAYDVLGNAARRAVYDASIGLVEPSERMSDRPDVRVDVKITLAEAFSGCAREISYSQIGACEPCGGRHCTRCRGTRRASMLRTISVAIPAGIEDGARLRLPSTGAHSNDADLLVYVVVRVQRDQTFRRVGRDVYLEEPVSFATLALGGEIQIASVGGEMFTLTIDPLTDVGTERRIVGLGMPSVGSAGRGDLHVTLALRMPRFLTAEARGIIERLSAVL